MDDDDEIQSHRSPGSQSPASPRPAGRITVTVAAAGGTGTGTPQQQQTPSPPLALPPPQNALTLALPIQQTSKGGGREDCWSEAATAVLIEAWGERYLELSRGNLKQKHWKEVADIVNGREDHRKIPKTDIQCKNRVDTVKKKYKLEKAKVSSGAGPSKWPLYSKLDHLVGPAAKTPSASAAASKVPVGIPITVRGGGMFLKNHPHNTTTNIEIKRRVLPPAASISLPPEEDEEEEDASEASLGSTDSEGFVSKRPRMSMNLAMKKSKKRKRGSGWGGAVRELTSAIVKFGEAYEKAESLKIQQVVEMEKQRMKFAKDLELQRMHFFMKTQLEISQLKHHGNGGNGNGGSSRRGVGIGNPSNIYHSNNNNNNNNNNNSDSSN